MKKEKFKNKLKRSEKGTRNYFLGQDEREQPSFILVSNIFLMRVVLVVVTVVVVNIIDAIPWKHYKVEE